MIKFRTFTSVLFSAALFTHPSLASDDKVSITVSAKKTSALGQLIQGVDNGVYKLTETHIEKALTDGYVPEKGEPTVVDLINKYYVVGEMEKFYEEVGKLSDRGDPVAWGFYGWYLANRNLSTDKGDYERGQELMKKAAQAGVAAAYNNEAMILWLAKDEEGALKYLSGGTADPHDLANYGLILKERKEPARVYLPVLMRGAEAGDPGAAFAVGQYYADPEGGHDLCEALKWYLISYQGFSCMDQFDGLEPIMDFLSTNTFSTGEYSRVYHQVYRWLETHPQMFMDGFGMVRLGAQVNNNPSVETLVRDEPNSVLGCFWRYYAIGDKLGFSDSLEPFLQKEDANALYMKAHLARGFIGDPIPGARRVYLERAVRKHHPMAYLELALDLWIQGSLESDPDQKQADLHRAAKLLKEGYDKWHDTQHVGAIAELIFFLGYFTEFGIGFDEPNQREATHYYHEAFYWTPLVAGWMGRQAKDPSQSLAYLSIARSSFTTGDWFGGVHHWQNKMQSTTAEQKEKASRLAKAILAKSKGITWNYYQRMAAGLDPAFSGL